MIQARDISFSIGDFALKEFSLEVPAEKYCILLGPPGSGKTIFLECLCGLKQIESGSIHIGDRDVTLLEPRSRSIGYVPQDYALFPHLTVYGNIQFGLKVAGMDSRTITERVRGVTDMLGIGHLLTRRIPGLSGGEKQRTALARALVMEPRLLLLDEPVCALDEGTRQRICSLLLKIQRQLKLTVIHVSHNLEEAFSVADVAAILDGGRLRQIGTLNELLRRPADEFVARFMRCENILPVVAEPNGNSSQSTATLDGVRLTLPGTWKGPVKLVIRPEDIALSTDPASNSENRLQVTPARWRDYGAYMRVELRGAASLIAHVAHTAFSPLGAEIDKPLIAHLPSEAIHVLVD